MTTTKETPRVYIASLTDYNEGRLVGKWFDLDDFSDSSDMLEAITDYLNELNESEPLEGGEVREEWAAHDYENFPESLYSESMDFEAFYEYWNAVADMDEERAEAFGIFCDNSGEEMNSETLEQFEEAYQGKYGGNFEDAKLEFTYQLVDDLGYLNEVPESIQSYFDYGKFSRDLFIGDYWEEQGHIFRNL